METLRKFGKFVCTGVFILVWKLLATFSLEYEGLSIEWAYLITILSTMFWGYVINFYFTFNNKTGHNKKIVSYISSIVIFYFIDYCFVMVLQSYIWELYSIVISTGIVFMFKFLVYNYIIFKEVK